MFARNQQTSPKPPMSSNILHINDRRRVLALPPRPGGNMGAWPAVCNPQHPLLRPDKSKGAAAVFQFSAPGAPRLPPPSHTAAQFSAIRAEPGTLRRTRPSGPGPARSPGCCVALAARNQAVQTGSPLRYARRPPSARAAPSRHRAADAASSKPSPRRPSRRKRPRRPLKTAALPPHPGGSTVRAQDDPGGWLRRPLKT